MDNTVPRLLEIHLPERIPQTEEVHNNKEVCCVLQEQQEEGDNVLVSQL
jgi:hypothetical protein